MNDDLNGTPMPPLPALPLPGRPDVIQVLEQALIAARQGKVVGVAVVLALGPDALNMSSAGMFPSTLIAGCQQLSRNMLDAMFAKRSSVFIPRR